MSFPPSWKNNPSGGSWREEKRYTDESELICWHYDHTFNSSINVAFDYVVNDSWFSSVENMQMVKEELNIKPI